MRPQAKIALVAAVLLLATLGLLIYAMLGQARVRCEVCVTFRGKTQCRTAAGPNRQQATRTATENACGFLASGMADSMSCSQTPPDVVTCN